MTNSPSSSIFTAVININIGCITLWLCVFNFWRHEEYFHTHQSNTWETLCHHNISAGLKVGWKIVSGHIIQMQLEQVDTAHLQWFALLWRAVTFLGSMYTSTLTPYSRNLSSVFQLVWPLHMICISFIKELIYCHPARSQDKDDLSENLWISLPWYFQVDTSQQKAPLQSRFFL